MVLKSLGGIERRAKENGGTETKSMHIQGLMEKRGLNHSRVLSKRGEGR